MAFLRQMYTSLFLWLMLLGNSNPEEKLTSNEWIHSTGYKGQEKITVHQIHLAVHSVNHSASLRFYHKKPKRTLAPCLYYPNSCASRQLLLLGGDVALNPGPNSSSTNCKTIKRETKITLKCASLNARSLKSQHKSSFIDKICNLVAFQQFVYSGGYDIIAVTETWLTSDIMDCEILERGYTIFRRDRQGRTGGGVLLAVRDNLVTSRRQDLETNLEMVCVEVNTLGSSKVLVSVVYRPPGHEDDTLFMEGFSMLLQNLSRSSRSQIVILGDFNFPAIHWTENCGYVDSENSVEHFFCESLKDFSLFQLNDTATRFTSSGHGNILDLVISNVPERVSSVEVLNPEETGIFTDHHVLLFDLAVHMRRTKKPDRHVYNFKAANFVELKRDIRLSSGLETSSSLDNINECWQNWKNTLLHLADKHIPKVKIKNSNTPPWIDGEVKHALRKKETARRAYRKYGGDGRLSKFKELRRDVKRLIEFKYVEYSKSIGESITENPKRFWSFFRYKTRSNSIPDIVSYKGQLHRDSHSQAEAFNQFFFSTFTSDESSYPNQHDQDSQVPKLDSIVLTNMEVLSSLSSLDPRKAPGSDGLPTSILKECATELCPSICNLFNKSLATGEIPEEWKHSVVVPVFKKGKKEDVTNYRPISLLSVLSKVLERCVYNNLMEHIAQFFTDAQHGFLKGRSTVTQLLSFYHNVGLSLDKGLQTDVIYLDLAKAFDSVSHRKLLVKLTTYGISDTLLKWMENYLSDRYQKCIINGVTSSSLPVTSGVPQGSILGPLLFLVYVNDLPTAVNNNVVLFADDSKLCNEINCEDDAKNLQSDLDTLSVWSKQWSLRYNSSKCEALSITRKKSPITYQYEMDGVPLNQVTSQRDLGVTITSNLKWDCHIIKIVSKGYKMLGFLCRHLNKNFSLTTRRLLYLTFIRSQVGYASELWAPQTICSMQRLEQLQRRSTKFILNLHWQNKVPYIDRLRQTNLLPLTYWHEAKDLIFYFRCRLGYYNINITDFVKPKMSIRSTRNSSDLDVHVPRCRTKLFQASYFNRLAKLWNNLPVFIRSSTSLAQFKSRLLKFYKDASDKSYNQFNFLTWKSLCPKCSSSLNLLLLKQCCY